MWYRIPAVASGILSVFLLAFSRLDKTRVETFTLLFVSSLSYPLILYSSQARGYAPAILFSLVSFILIQRYRQKRAPWKLPLFWAAVVLGFLFQITFFYFFISLLVWSIVHEARASRTGSEAFRELIKEYLVPVSFLVVLYECFIKNMFIGGGPVYPWWDGLKKTMALAAGAPETGPPAWAGISAVLIMFILGVGFLYVRKNDIYVFFLCVLAVVPALTVIITRPPVLYPRYFLVCFPFFYLLAGHLLAHLFLRSGTWKAVYVILMLLFVFGNAARTMPLLPLGKGGYREAVLFMAKHTAGREISVGSDHDFRNTMYLSFYSRYLPSEKEIFYVKTELWTKILPEWAISHSSEIKFDPPKRVTTSSGSSYTLSRSFRYVGWHWFLYHNDYFGPVLDPCAASSCSGG